MRWRARRALLLALARLGRGGPYGVNTLFAVLGAALHVLGLALLRLAQERQGAAGALDLLAGRFGGGVHGDRERLRQLAVREQLDVLAQRTDQALLLQRLGRHLVAGGELRLEVADVDRLGVRAERADRHRVRGG